MKESILHYIWKFQQFDRGSLNTVQGEPIEVYFNGNHNHNAGPDFNDARIKIGSMVWHGSVEIHVHAHEWKMHDHHSDPLYNNVVLHVVWNNNRSVTREDGQMMPTLELKTRVSYDLLARCHQLIDSQHAIPCTSHIPAINSMVWSSMIQSSGIERLEKKSMSVDLVLAENNNDWEETCYHLLVTNFGFKVNCDAFVKLARVLSSKIIARHRGNLFQIEALLFGMAGFLDECLDNGYHKNLRREFEFLSKKYSLGDKKLYLVEWKKLRLRPANFPELRIAQLAAVLNEHQHLFDLMVRQVRPSNLKKQLRIPVSEYWTTHHSFQEKPTDKKVGQIGTSSVHNLIINTAVPLLMTYSRHIQDEMYCDTAIKLLESIPPENNKVLRSWSTLNIKPVNAFDSQALIQLHNEYCLNKRCLSCKIGVSLIH